MSKVLMLVFSDLRHDARVLRHINFLKNQFDLTVLCIDAEETAEYQIVRLPHFGLTMAQKVLAGLLLKIRLYKAAYRVLYPLGKVVEELRKLYVDLIIANDVETLPLAFTVKGENARVVFDAHEYAPRHVENKASWRFFFQPFYIHLCRTYIPLTAGMITVGQAIANEYEKHFGIHPRIVTNAPSFRELAPNAVNRGRIRLVHHGIVTASRDLGNMIEMMRHLPEQFTLDLILLIPPRASAATIDYLEQLKQQASFTDRIRFRDPEPVDKIINVINEYDIGIIMIPPINFNYANCLPNKFFDYVQGRVGLAIGPTPEMKAIVKQFDLGVVAESFDPLELAEKIRELSVEDIMRFKANANSIAEKFSAENNKEIYLSVVKTALA